MIFEGICTIDVEDDVKFSVTRTTDIREGDDYPGLRVSLTASYPPLMVPLTVDVTTGDKITPHEIEYSFNLMFDDRSISILAYNLETILAEKLETVLSRNIANTRPRDFYDLHVLYALRGAECDFAVLRQALNETAHKRGSLPILVRYREIISSIQASPQMKNFWTRYCLEFDYAKDISFDDVCRTVLRLMHEVYGSE